MQGRGPLCLECESRVHWITPPMCDHCGLPGAQATAECEECRDRFSFRRARAAARYEGPARDALKGFKLSGERRAARALARPMLEAIGKGWSGTHEAVAYVPATRKSVHERGFNPAEELARPIAKAMRLPLAKRLLTKTRETKDQAGLGKAERKANLAGAFAANASPKAVLLVDDVFTTGATADACARALRDKGANHVDVVTFARAGRAPVPRTITRA
jgi:ComF family protein